MYWQRLAAATLTSVSSRKCSMFAGGGGIQVTQARARVLGRVSAEEHAAAGGTIAVSLGHVTASVSSSTVAIGGGEPAPVLVQPDEREQVHWKSRRAGAMSVPRR